MSISKLAKRAKRIFFISFKWKLHAENHRENSVSSCWIWKRSVTSVSSWTLDSCIFIHFRYQKECKRYWHIQKKCINKKRYHHWFLVLRPCGPVLCHLILCLQLQFMLNTLYALHQLCQYVYARAHRYFCSRSASIEAQQSVRSSVKCEYGSKRTINEISKGKKKNSNQIQC